MTLQKKLQQHISELSGVSLGEVVVEHPADLARGDYATPVALLLGKREGRSPREIAEDLAKKLEAADIEEVEKIEVAGAGFLNFFLTRDFFREQIQKATEFSDEWGKNESLRGKKYLVEKSAPNLFKPFHVGHLLNISIGESLSRLFRHSSAEVVDVAYPSDISLGVAKAVWAIMKKGIGENLSINQIGECYVYGTKMYEEDAIAKQEIDTINRELNLQQEGEAWGIYQRGRELNLGYFDQITKRLGSTFAGHFFESDSGRVGKEVVLEHLGDVFEESEGAIIFRGENYGLHTRVFITSQGLPVYEAKDIGLLKQKFEHYDPDLSVVITDVEQREYFQVIKQAASLINKEWAKRSLYWQHGRLRFAEGKISSRLGNVPLAEDLLEQVKQIVSEKIRNPERFLEDEMRVINEVVAIGALKYAFLRSGSGKNIIFDFEKSVSLEGDSGPYLQYAHARGCSILEKGSAVVFHSNKIPTTPWAIERLLYQFEEVVERAAEEFEPHYVATYLLELASAFNSFYAVERIIDDEEFGAYKLALTKAFTVTMKNGLYLLGIEAPTKM